MGSASMPTRPGIGWRHVDPLDGQERCRFDAHQHVIVGYQVGRQVEVDAHLQHGKTGVRGGIDDRPPRRIPTPTDEESAIPAQIGIGIPRDAPADEAHAATP